MAVDNIFQRYGIKEVADVGFYNIKDDGTRGDLVLYLDSLRVSTIEQTAEQTEARGGKGNPPLIIWDYGKEINITIEDALFSAKSMEMMFGNATKGEANGTTIAKSIQMRATKEEGEEAATITAAKIANTFDTDFGIRAADIVEDSIKVLNPATGESESAASATLTEGAIYQVSYEVLTKHAHTIEISASKFAGTYYIVGDTYARNETTGKDEFFQFIIPKAKMNTENTLTLEAEGDPTVFNMSLRVMRPADGKMMKLVKYDFNMLENDKDDDGDGKVDDVDKEEGSGLSL